MLPIVLSGFVSYKNDHMVIDNIYLMLLVLWPLAKSFLLYSTNVFFNSSIA